MDKTLIDFSKLEDLTENSVKEAVKEVYGKWLLESEGTIQNKTSEEIDDLKLRAPKSNKKSSKDVDEEEAEGEPAPANPSSSSDKKPEIIVPDTLPDVLEAESIIKAINVIRSGNSLKDQGVQDRFKIYFDGLKPAEKIALKGFLDGLAQVIAGDVPGEDAASPSSPPYNVDMEDAAVQKDKGETASIHKSIDPNADAPIVVGEISNKDWVREVFNRNKF